jgi:hypothetical protein
MIYLVHARIERDYFKKLICWCGWNDRITDYYLIESDTSDIKVISDKLIKALESQIEVNPKPNEEDVVYHLKEIYSIKPVIN